MAQTLRRGDAAAARVAGFVALADASLGLMSQALCWRPLRGLSELGQVMQKGVTVLAKVVTPDREEAASSLKRPLD